MAIYKENLTVRRKKKEIWPSFYLGCCPLPGKNRLSVAYAACKFCHWQLVYYYYKKWPVLECFDLLLAKLREKVRFKMGQNRQVSLGIMDSIERKMGEQPGIGRL